MHTSSYSPSERASAHGHAHGYDSDPHARTAISPPRWPVVHEPPAPHPLPATQPARSFVLFVPPSALHPAGLELHVEHRGGSDNAARTQWFHIERRPLLDDPFAALSLPVLPGLDAYESVEARVELAVETRPELPSARPVASPRLPR